MRLKKPVKLGLYGCGNRTRALLRAVEGEGYYEVARAYDVRKKAAGELCGKYGGRVCESSAELVKAADVEAFIISLDPRAHPAAFYEAAEAGKPVFIEKPVALDAGEAYRMMKAAEEKKIPVQVGFMRRYNPGVQAAVKYMREKDPGKIFSIACRWFHPGETEMINMLNNSPDNFRLKVSQIPFHCCHALDVMMVLCGRVDNVYSRGIKAVKRQYPSPDEVVSSLEFKSGVIGLFHYSSMAYRQGIDYLLHAENYTLEITSNRLAAWTRPEHKSQREDGSPDCRKTYRRNTGPEEHIFGASSEDIQIMTSFLEGVRKGKKLSPSLLEGWLTADLAEAVETSFREDRMIGLPLTERNEGET